MRYLSAGESHGKGLVFIIEGFPANVVIDIDEINHELSRRQKGYGRGKRMTIEQDKIEILSGVRFGKTLGSPIGVLIKNKDWDNWKLSMSTEDIFHDESICVTEPRPGHADLTGIIKYNQDDIRNILERASARETAIRTATGAFAKQLLKNFNITTKNRVLSIGGVEDITVNLMDRAYWLKIKESDVSMFDEAKEQEVKDLIDEVKSQGNTLGGIVEVHIENVPIGLGSHVHYDRKISGRLAMEIMAMQSVKGIEIGDGFLSARNYGSKVHDEIFYNAEKGYYHSTNHAGGIEGGMSNGETIWFRAAVKPIPTLMQPLKTVDIRTKQPVDACKERSDVCAVPAAGVIMENIAAWVIAKEMTEKFGKDTLEEMYSQYQHYLAYIKTR